MHKYLLISMWTTTFDPQVPLRDGETVKAKFIRFLLLLWSIRQSVHVFVRENIWLHHTNGMYICLCFIIIIVSCQILCASLLSFQSLQSGTSSGAVSDMRWSKCSIIIIIVSLMAVMRSGHAHWHWLSSSRWSAGETHVIMPSHESSCFRCCLVTTSAWGLPPEALELRVKCGRVNHSWCMVVVRHSYGG